MIEALADVVKNPPTKEDVDKVRERLLKGLEDQHGQHRSLSPPGLSEPIAQGDWRLMFLEHDRLKDVSPQDIVRVAKLYLKESNLTVGYYIPTETTRIAPWSRKRPIWSATLANYKSTATIAHGETFDPTPANIESRVARGKLANGMKVVMLKKQTTEQHGLWRHRTALRR